MAALYDVYIEAGSVWFITLKLTNFDGTSKDLTDFTASMKLMSGATVIAEPLVVFDNDRTTGKVTFSLTDVETAAMSGSGTHNVEITSVTPVTTRILQGNWVVDPDVTP